MKKKNNRNVRKNNTKNKNTSDEQKMSNRVVDTNEIEEEYEEYNEDFDEEITKGIDIVKSHNEKLTQERYERLYENKEENLKRKNNVRYKIKPVLVSTITIVIILVIYFLFEYGPILGINVNKDTGISEDSKIDIITSESDIYATYDNELLVFSNNTISTYNSYLQNTWNYELTDGFTPNIYINDSYMVIANNSNGTIYMFDNKTEIFSKKIEGTIQDIYIDDYGNIAVEYSTTGYKKIIGVYDRNGKGKFDAYLSTSNVVDVKIIDNCKKLLVAQVNTNSFKVGITFSIVDSTKEEDNITELCTCDNSMVYDVNVQGQSAIILFDTKISKLDLSNGNITDVVTFDDNQPLFISINDSYYTYLIKELNENENAYTIATCKYDGTTISQTKVENSPKELYSSGLLNYFIYQDSIKVINKWGVEIKNIPLDSIPKDVVIFNNEKSIGLVYTNKIYIVNI